MPILAMDKMGRIYETSGDREDGLGFKSFPECVDQQDVTLGSAYLKANERHKQDVLQIKREQRYLDAKDRAWEAKMKREKAIKAKAEIAEYLITENNDVIKRNQLKKALSMGACSCSEVKTALSGNGLSANGMSGKMGMSRDQLTIHNAVNPKHFPNNTAHRVDPTEAWQHEQRMRAESILRRRSR